MRFVFCLIILAGIVVGSHAQAQEARQPVYNSTTTSKSSSQGQVPTIYNSTRSSSSSRSSAAPISIRNLTRQKQQASRANTRSTNNTYGFDNRDSRGRSVLSLTPADIRAKQRADVQAAQDRVRSARQQREQQQAALQEQKNGGRAAQYKNQFQDGEKPRAKRRSVYRQGNDVSPIPRPVFNQVR